MSYGGRVVDITQPGYFRGRAPANKGKTYPAEVLTPDEHTHRAAGILSWWCRTVN